MIKRGCPSGPNLEDIEFADKVSVPREKMEVGKLRSWEVKKKWRRFAPFIKSAEGAHLFPNFPSS
jgi:hypothetical protein